MKIEPFTSVKGEKLKAVTANAYANPITDKVYVKNFFHLNPEIRTLLKSEHITQQAVDFAQPAKLITSSVAGMLNEPVSQFLSKISQPTLEINGALDAAIPNKWLHPKMTVNDIQNMSRVIPKSEQVIFRWQGIIYR